MNNITPHQAEVMSSLLSADESIVALVGPAGVGKSFTIAEFIKDNKDDVAVTGSTHRAVANVSEMSDMEGKTIHSFLGFTMVNKGTQTFLKPRKDFAPDLTVKYLIIDEMSMLTNQIMSRIEEYIEMSPRLEKVILIGDIIQLRLPGAIELGSIPSFELTEQLRQENTPNITKALGALRFAIEHNTELTTMFEEGEDLLVYDDHYEFLKAYKKSKLEKMFLMFQNKTVKTYNDNVKKHVLMDENRFSPGDEVYPTSPIIIDDKVRITNRQVVTITKAIEEDNHYELNTNFGPIKVAKTKQVLNDYLQNLADAKDWREFYKLKETFADVHHMWAGSSHSAQGLSIDEVFVDFPDLQAVLGRGSVNDLYRLLYVAISRCRTRAHIFVGDERVYKALGEYTRKSKK